MKTLSRIALALFLASNISGAEKVIAVKLKAGSEAPGYEAQNAMDGDPATIWHTAFGESTPGHPHFLDIDLGQECEISGFEYLPRDGGGNGTIQRFALFVSESPDSFGDPAITGSFTKTNGGNEIKLSTPRKGRHLRLEALSEVSGGPWTSVAELKIVSPDSKFRADSGWAFSVPGRGPAPVTELEWQYSALLRDLRRRDHIGSFSNQTFRTAALIQPSDRDPADIVARRTAALFADLKSNFSVRTATDLEKQLRDLQPDLTKTPVENIGRRYELYERICGLRRQIAFANSLLDFNEILFLKRHRSLFNHMCDQYYGITARPGGGLFVLSNPFGSNPSAREILADATVENGRLAGRKLANVPTAPNKTYNLHYEGEGKLSGDKPKEARFSRPRFPMTAKPSCLPTSNAPVIVSIGITPIQRVVTGRKDAPTTFSRSTRTAPGCANSPTAPGMISPRAGCRMAGSLSSPSAEVGISDAGGSAPLTPCSTWLRMAAT